MPTQLNWKYTIIIPEPSKMGLRKAVSIVPVSGYTQA